MPHLFISRARSLPHEASPNPQSPFGPPYFPLSGITTSSAREISSAHSPSRCPPPRPAPLALTHLKAFLHHPPPEPAKIPTFLRARTIALGRRDPCELLRNVSEREGTEVENMSLDGVASNRKGAGDLVLRVRAAQGKSIVIGVEIVAGPREDNGDKGSSALKSR